MPRRGRHESRTSPRFPGADGDRGLDQRDFQEIRPDRGQALAGGPGRRHGLRAGIAASGYANPAGCQDQPEQYHMMSGDSDSYLEQCIAALPPEKREAARGAFAEISETGDDTYLSKLLAVLEANGAYAKMIPKRMTETGAKVVREMEDIASRLIGAEVHREALFKNTITAETVR